MKQLTYLAFLSLTSLSIFSCLDSSSESNSTLEKNITIPFMAHSGTTHLSCGTEMSELGSTNEIGKIKDFRVFIHDANLIDEDGESYPITLEDNDFQTANVTLLSFMNKAADDCPSASGEDITTNMNITGKYKAPKNAVLKGLSFKVGVPFELNHKNPTEAESPLNISSMAWNWQGGYKHMRLEADIDGNSFLFHLGSIGCDGEPLSGGTTACTRNNRPEIILDHFDFEMSAVQIDFQSLVDELDLSSGGSCHSNAGQAAICQGAFDALGLDFYDGSDNTLEQANEGQTVFKTAMNHN